MATVLKIGPRKWSGSGDAEGERTFKVTYRITFSAAVGPAEAMDAAGLPGFGTRWALDGDNDFWTFRLPTTSTKPVVTKDGDPSTVWDTELTFSTKQPERCNEQRVEDPLSEPQKISGSFVKYTKEIEKDKDGNFIKSSSHELIRGPIVEFDHNRPTVVIEQNVGNLGLSTFTNMVDTVNDSALWGLGTRTIKLSNVSWSREMYGLCYFYYTRRFEFDIDFDTFDRQTKDQGLKVLRGQWLDGNWVLDFPIPNANDARDFDRFKDAKGEVARTFLDGNGLPAASIEAAATIDIEFYPESNFLLLNIPTTL